MSVEETNRYEKDREQFRKKPSALVKAKLNPPSVGTRAEQDQRSSVHDDNSFAASELAPETAKSYGENHAEKEAVFAEHRKRNGAGSNTDRLRKLSVSRSLTRL